MDAILRASAILLLIVAEATQQAMLGDDFSVTNALIVVSTLMGLDLVFQMIAWRSPRFERLTEGMPLIVVEEGRVHHERLARAKRRAFGDPEFTAVAAAGVKLRDAATTWR